MTVAGYRVDRVYPVDTYTSTRLPGITFTDGSGPESVAMSPDGRRAYITNHYSGTVSMIDVATSAVLADVSVGYRPKSLAVTPDGSKVYVTLNGDSGLPGTTVAVLSGDTLATVAGPINVASRPYGIAVSGTHAYVTHFAASGSVTVIDTTTDTVSSTSCPTARHSPL